MTVSNEAVEAAGLKFRKKPVVIEAAKIPALFDIEGRMAFEAWANPLKKGRTLRWVGEGISVETLEGVMRAPPGDWLICGIQGELYPCAADIFAATYEPAAPHMLPAPEGVSEAEKRVADWLAAKPYCELKSTDVKAILTSLSSERERAERAEARAANLQMQAESWAMEARGHKSTVHEAYQAVTGATGEPGNWHGAEPIKAALADAEARAQAAEAKVKGAVEALSFYAPHGEAWVLRSDGDEETGAISDQWLEPSSRLTADQGNVAETALRWIQGEGE